MMIRQDVEWRHMPGDYRLAYDAMDAELTKGKTRRLWVEGIDFGRTTGIGLISVPRESIYGNEPGRILSHHSWEVTGTFRMQIRQVCAIALRIANRTSPCLMVAEDFDLGGNKLTGQASEADVVISARMGAALQYAVECGHADNSILMYQGRTIAFQTAKDERLRKWGLWDVGSDHKRDANRHAITMIRRIANGSVNPQEIWG